MDVAYALRTWNKDDYVAYARRNKDYLCLGCDLSIMAKKSYCGKCSEKRHLALFSGVIQYPPVITAIIFKYYYTQTTASLISKSN